MKTPYGVRICNKERMSVVSFENSELNTNVMTFVDENKGIWLRAQDVAVALKYSNPKKAVRDEWTKWTVSTE